MNDKLIITLPVAPYSPLSVGKMTTPILGESLAKTMNAKFVMSLNLLSTYQKRDSEGFYNLMKNYNINPDYYWCDSEHINELIEKVYSLIKMGYIKEKEKKIILCDCGKVEIDSDNIETINMDDTLIEIVNGKYYCKSCKKECHTIVKKALVFDSRMVDKSNLVFYPEFMNKERVTFDDTVGSHDVIISRKRDTGIVIEINNNQYNIDIDFIWEIFLSLFNESEKIVMCGNRQLFQLYMVGMLEKCFNRESKTVCLATPYLEKSDKQILLENRKLSLKVFTLLSLKWAKKSNTFDETLLKYINSMNVQKKQMLYDILIEEIQSSGNLEVDLKKVLTKKYNLQNANSELKRRRKNG